MNSEELAWKIRRHAIEMTHLSKGSHIGSILSVADIIAILYADVLHIDPQNAQMEDRDRIILSKGHAGAAIYAALAEKGFFPISELSTHYSNGSRLSGHVSHKGVPGVEFSTGSLGHGLPVATGMAYAAKLQHKKHHIYVVIGDGELNEGSNWEAMMFAHHFKLDNLTVIIDYNKMQSLTFCEETISLKFLDEKIRSFGFNIIDIDGHNHDELRKSFKTSFDNKSPTCIIANTIKGEGIPFMENNILWHYRSPQGEEYIAAVSELEKIKR